jgi:hypothetical protein
MVHDSRKWLLALALMFILLVPAACTTSTATPSATTTPSAAGPSVTIDLTAKNFAFDKSTVTVPAGAHDARHLLLSLRRASDHHDW